MVASIGEPFALATYAGAQPPQNSASQRRRPATLFASHHVASGSSEGYVTTTVQADGIHLLDVSALHPVVSHTLGPSTTFCCPAVTQSTSEGADKICTTYAPIASSVDISEENSGRTLWAWKENLSKPSADRAFQTRKTTVITHRISQLLTSHELSSRVLALSPSAEITVLDTDLSVKASWAPNGTFNVLRAFIYSRNCCSFVPSQLLPSMGSILVLITASEQVTHMRVLSLDETDSLLELGDCSISLDSKQIVQVSCSSTGFVSFLVRDGTWCSYVLESTTGSAFTISNVSEPFRLKGLSFIAKDSRDVEVSLIPLTSSHVLLAGLSNSSSPEIFLLLWDLQFSVLLASQALPVPPTILQSGDVTIDMTLVSATDSQALLVLTPDTQKASDAVKKTSHSSILVIPFTCPLSSTIANAMGQGSAAERWVDQAATSALDVTPSPHYDPTRLKVLMTMRTAMEKNLPQAADVAFFEWEKRTAKLPSLSETSIQHPVLNDAFVKDLLLTVFQLSRPPNTPYTPDVVRYLLNRKLISSTMLEHGLLVALRAKHDWESITLSFTSVPDLSEIEIIESLFQVITQHRQHEVAGTDAMQVDAVTKLPSLPSFLAACVSYTCTPAALRSAIRHTLRDAEDIYCVLKVIENWLLQWISRDVRLLASKKDIKKNEYGIPVLVPKETGNKGLPPLEKILEFSQVILDASFLIILAHAPTHRLLRNIRAHLEPQIIYNDELEQLRVPLESFAKAHSKAVKEAGEDKSKKPVEDWRRKRKQVHEQAGMSIGLYRLEELVL